MNTNPVRQYPEEQDFQVREQTVKPGDSVYFFENAVNAQRTCGVIVEKMMTKQYKVGMETTNIPR